MSGKLPHTAENVNATIQQTRVFTPSFSFVTDLGASAVLQTFSPNVHQQNWRIVGCGRKNRAANTLEKHTNEAWSYPELACSERKRTGLSARFYSGSQSFLNIGSAANRFMLIRCNTSIRGNTRYSFAANFWLQEIIH